MPPEPSPSRPSLALEPRRVTRALAVALLVVVACYVAVVAVAHTAGMDVHWRFPRLFRVLDMDGETNLPAWFSVLLLGLAALTAGLAAATAPRGRGGFRWHWAVAAAALAFLSLDEAALLHEELSRPVVDLLGLDAFRWGLWAWVIPYVTIAVVGLVAAIPFFRHLGARTRLLLLLGAALYVGGAGGMELVGRELWTDPDTLSLAYRAAVGVEEVLEMVGVLTVIRAVLVHLRDRVGAVELAFRPTTGTSAPDPTSAASAAVAARPAPEPAGIAGR